MSKKNHGKKSASNVKNEGSSVNEIAGIDGENVTEKKKSPYVYQRDKIAIDLKIRERDDLTEKQKVILETMTHKDTRCVMIDGLWGSSKTYCAMLASLRLLNTGRVKQIFYVRNPISASNNSKIGFLAGSIEEKMLPYAMAMQDKLYEMLDGRDVKYLMEDERVECIPTGFLQGRSFNCSAIIVDECASMSWEDLMLIISRCGPFTRIFFLGDTINQVYLSEQSGYSRIFNCFSDDESKENGVFTFELKEESDIVRSGFIRFVMRKVGVIKDRSALKTEPMFA